MRVVVVIALAVGASGCQIVFPLETDFDLVPHVKQVDEFPGTSNITVDQIGESINTDSDTPTGIGLGASMIEKIAQDGDQSDLRVLRADTLTIASTGSVTVRGSLPLVIIANTIVIDGTLDASSLGNGLTAHGGGGGLSSRSQPGEGHQGSFDAMPNDNNGGGGGGANAPGAGDGGRIDCFTRSAAEGKAGSPIGSEDVPILIGGGAGGRGGNKCPDAFAEGGAGGGAVQLSALVSITIGSTGRLIADGGGGDGGIGGGSCPTGGQDGGGGGGGAGGTIYLDAPTIHNDGVIEAHGGGGAGGAPDASGSTAGDKGRDGSDPQSPSAAGIMKPPKGQAGGSGATVGTAAPGMSNMCLQVTDAARFNAGGGGGGPGRIVFRGNDLLFGTEVSPDPKQLAYGE